MTGNHARAGFVYLPSFGEAFAATGSEEARRQVLAAAEATAWAFNPATNSTRTFEGWDPPAATRNFRRARCCLRLRAAPPRPPPTPTTLHRHAPGHRSSRTRTRPHSPGLLI